MVETSNDQILQQGYESMTRLSCKFYRQVTYGDQPQAYVFADTNALVPAESSMYIIYMNQLKGILGTIQVLGNLDKFGQENVTGQPGICYAKM